MIDPKESLIFPLDVADLETAAHYVDLLADLVGMFKVGLELFVGHGPRIVEKIKSAGSSGVFLDLKLHDIPATVYRATEQVAHLGVSLATVHCGESPRMLEAAVSASGGRVGILGVTVLTSIGAAEIQAAGFREEFCSGVDRLVLQRARMARAAGCAGVVCSGKEVAMIKQALGKDFLAVTPGIRPSWQAVCRDDQARMTTPAQAIEGGADYLVIGRPIRDASDPRDAARRVLDEIAAARGA